MTSISHSRPIQVKIYQPSSFDVVELISSGLGIFASLVRFFLCVGKFGFDIIKSGISAECRV